MAVAVERAPRSRHWTTGTHRRALIEARRYRAVARHMVIASLPTLLRVKAQAVEDLLQGRVRFLTPAQAGRFEALCSTRTADWLRGSRRYDHITTGELPVELLIPVVHYGMERYGREGAAALCGMTTRSMFRILSDSTSVSFALADRLVTGLDGPGWWLETNERMGWYYAHDRGLER